MAIASARDVAPAATAPTLRLLAITDRAYPTDHAFLQEVLGRELPKRKIDVHLLMIAAKNAEPGVYEYGLSTVIAHRSVLGRTGLLLPALREIQRWKPDAVVVRNLAVVAVLLRIAAGVRYMFQISHFKEETAKLQGADPKGGYLTWIARHAACSIGIWLRRLAARWSERVWVVSDTMKQSVRAQIGPEMTIDVVPLGATGYHVRCDCERGEIRKRLGIGKEEPFLIYIGTLNQARRLQTLVEALSLLPSGALAFVGAGPRADDRRVLGVEAERLGVSSRIRFIDWLPRDEVQAYLAEADLGVSYYPDEAVFHMNSPMKVMEYLAAGLPVVCTPQADQRWAVEVSQGGVVACGYSATDLAEAIRVALGRNWNRSNIRAAILAERSYERIGASVAASVRETVAGRIAVR